MSLPFLSLVAIFVGLAILRVPIAIALIAAGMGYLILAGQDPGLVAEQIMNRLYSSYILLAIPMFILAANAMNAGTISERLWRAADRLVGRFRGGLGHITVLTSLVFASMSGSAIADAAGPGMIAMRMMRQVGGYRPGFAVALTAAAATIAPIIPPSIPMVLYALNANTSVGAMFLAGIGPGLLMGIALMATIAIVAGPMNLPEGHKPEKRRLSESLMTLPALSLPVLLLGGIWSGAFTPTEAAAVAGLYALAIAGIIYRALDLKAVAAVFVESMRSSVVVILLIAGAFFVNYAVTAERLDRELAGWIVGQELSPLAFLLVVNVVFLLLGCLIDTGTLLLVVVPVLLPSVTALGIDPVHFGVVVVENLMIGLITPPFGLLLFVLGRLVDVPLLPVVRALWPFLIALVAVLIAITYVPVISLGLPRLFGFL
ncbi:MAG: TRAP transporter large permease [Azospirillaceae bacterium]